MLKDLGWYLLQDPNPDAYEGVFTTTPVPDEPDPNDFVFYECFYRDSSEAQGITAGWLQNRGFDNLPTVPGQCALSPCGGFVAVCVLDTNEFKVELTTRMFQMQAVKKVLQDDLAATYLTDETRHLHKKILKIVNHTECLGAYIRTYKQVADILSDKKLEA